MQIKQALQLSQQLSEISDSPQLDMQYLLCHVLEKPESYLFTWPERKLESGETEYLEELVQRRLTGEPVAHIIGRRGFWSFELEVSSHTLIPRPDTEVLVEKALELCSVPVARVADLGTGTGAVALAIAKERPAWDVIASDYVKEAVELAERNRQRLHITNMKALQGSWYEPHSGQFDMIVSNPPYIDPADPHLEQGDVRFEPLSALTAENQGMADIEHIAKQGRHFLNKNGVLAFEHGFDQGAICRNLLQTLGYRNVGTQRDYGQNERVTYGVWPHDGYAEEN